MSELANAEEHNSTCQGLYQFQVRFPYRRMNIGFSQVETARAMNLNAKTFALFEQGVLEDKSLRRELKETLAEWLLAREEEFRAINGEFSLDPTTNNSVSNSDNKISKCRALDTHK